MKIGVISDTHLHETTAELEEAVREHFRDADLILHAGDITSLGVLEAFRGKEVIAVAGNRDAREVKGSVPQKQIVTAGGLKIGLVHGWGAPAGLKKRVASAFYGVQCIVYGHSHWPVNQSQDGILFFNPGAFSAGMFSLWRKSLGVLFVDREIRGQIIRLH